MSAYIKNKIQQIIYAGILLCFAHQYAYAQLVVNSNVTANQLVANLVAQGLIVSNVQLDCDTGAYGTFNGSTSNIGIASGILLTTGSVRNAVGPNNASGLGRDNSAYYTSGIPRDPDYGQIMDSNAVYDPCILQFDIVPQCDSLEISFVFGSEEYMEYVGADKNDAFGFFVTGPNPLGGNYNSLNIAWIPGTNIPVSVDSLNLNNYSSFYFDNGDGMGTGTASDGLTVQYDGFTKKMKANLKLVPCATYHFKIIIADGGDPVYDSGVFIDYLACKNVLQTAGSSTPPTCGNCDGTASVTAVNGVFPYNYQWFPGGATTSNVTGLCSGTYTVVVDDNLPCSPPDTSVFVVNNPFVLSAAVTNSNTPSCNGGSDGSITITASNGVLPYTYNWSSGSTNTSSTGLRAGIYTLTVSDATSCTFTLSTALSEPALLRVITDSIFPAMCIASNGRAHISGIGGTPPYNINWSNGATGMHNLAIPAAAYTATISDANGCSATTSLTVPANSNGTTITTVSTLSVSCNGYSDGSAEVMGTGGDAPYSYLWNTTHTGQSISNLTAGNYSVVATDANGCTSQTIINITQPPPISVTVTASPVLCFGDNNGAAITQVAGGASNYSFLWNNSETTASTSGLSPGTYTVIITDVNNCTVSATATITSPTALNVNIPQPASLCLGNQATINAVVGGGVPAYTYSWSSGVNTSSLIALPTTSTHYKVVVRDNNACVDSAEVLLTVLPLPNVSFDADITEGCPALCVNFSNSSSPSNQYSWSFGDGTLSSGINAQHCYQNEGIYTVSLTATDNNGCSNTHIKNSYIRVYPKPHASFVASPQPATILSPTIHFANTSTGGVLWSWSFGDVSGSTSTQQHPYHTYNDAGQYPVKLIVSNEHACADTADAIIQINPDFAVYIPNTFTPNDDGLNDIFIPVLSTDVHAYQLTIYNRWGMMLFNTNDRNAGWNGKVRGSNTIAQEDTYVWKLEIRKTSGDDTQTYIGKINLIR